MRFMTIYRPETNIEGAMPSPEHMAEMGKLIEEMMKAGALLDTGPLAPRDQCARVRLSNGAFTVTEETLRAGGWAFLNAADKDEAITLTKRFLQVAGDGEVEVRQVVEFAPQAA